MKTLYLLLLENFEGKRNAKYLKKILRYNLDLEDLNSIIRLYQHAGVSDILSDNQELEKALVKNICNSNTESQYYKIRGIYYLLDLFNNYRTQEFVGKYLEVSKGFSSYKLCRYKEMARFGIMIEELKSLYFNRALLELDKNDFEDFNSFQNKCGFVLTDIQIKSYLDHYFSEKSVRNYTFEDLQLLLKTCFLARQDIKVVNEYIYLRTLKLDKMKVQGPKETSVKENNKTVNEDESLEDLLLLGVAHGAINLLTNQLNTPTPQSTDFKFGGGDFGGGGASSNY